MSTEEGTGKIGRPGNNDPRARGLKCTGRKKKYIYSDTERKGGKEAEHRFVKKGEGEKSFRNLVPGARGRNGQNEAEKVKP